MADDNDIREPRRRYRQFPKAVGIHGSSPRAPVRRRRFRYRNARGGVDPAHECGNGIYVVARRKMRDDRAAIVLYAERSSLEQRPDDEVG